MTDLENLNNNTFNTSLEHITDEEAKNDITFSQESMGGQEIDDKKGRTMEEIQAELEPMNNQELGIKIFTVLKQYKALLKVITRNEKNMQVKNALKNWLNEQIKILEHMNRDYGQHTYYVLHVFKTRLGEEIYNLENFNKIYDDIVAGMASSDKYKKQEEKRIKKYESLDAKYKQEINHILYEKYKKNAE